MNTFFKNSFPTISVFFFTFLNLFLNKIFFDFGQFFVFQAIFFWLIYLPNLLPLYIIIIIGILQDIIFLSPLGSTPLVFLFLIFLYEKYNKFFLEPSFFELLISFIILFTVGMLFFWGLNSLINLKFLSLSVSFINEILLNLFFFPINYFILYFFYKKLNLGKYYKKNV